MVTAPDLVIERATPADAESLGWLIADSFASGDGAPMPATEWLVPDPDDRRRVLAAQFTILTEHASRWGQVDTTVGRDAVAVWMPVGEGMAAPPPPDYDRRLREACIPYAHRLAYLDRLFESRHPAAAHHHLMFLAVHTSRQGRGLGSALLRHHLRLLDRHGTPAYLEASGHRNRALYERHGFRPHGDPIDLARRAFFWPMWREPNTSA